MISKKYYKLLFSVFIFFSSFNVIISNGFAAKNSTTCEITNININCFNIHSSALMKINLFDNPYRIQVKFENKLIIKKNKINNSKFVYRVRVNNLSNSNTKLVIEFKKPTIISNIKYYKINNQSMNLSMYFQIHQK